MSQFSIGVKLSPLPQLHVPQSSKGVSPQGELGQRKVSVGTEKPKVEIPKSGSQQVGGSGAEKSRQVVVEPVKTYALKTAARHGELDTREQITARIGRPRNDISFGFFGTKKMSTGYKALLNANDSYRNQLDNPAPHKSSQEQLTSLKSALQSARDNCQTYIDKKGHTHKDDVQALNTRFGHELGVVNGLISDLEKGGKIPTGLSLKDAVAYARQGIRLEDMQEMHTLHLSPEQARVFVETKIADAELTPLRFEPYSKAGFTRPEAVQLERSGLGIEGGRAYRALHLAITPQTVARNFKPGTQDGAMKGLGSGAFNQVFAVKYGTSDGVVSAVFKPLRVPDGFTEIESGWVASKIGINLQDPQIAMRNLATGDLAQKLGFDVVARTEIGVRNPNEVGLVMERAQGREAHKVGSLLTDPSVQREVTKLQLLDHLTGQGDRHGGNYFIHVDHNGKPRITGIDNDQCFGRRPSDPDGIARGTDKATKGFRGTTMPPVVDTEMARSIRSLTPGDLDTMLAGKLTVDEISAAKLRLQGIKDHITQLELAGNVVTPEDWGSQRVQSLFNASNSYVGRDFQPMDFY